MDCEPVSGEITYGLERLAMYVQGVDNGFDLKYGGQKPDGTPFTYGDVFHQSEVEYSAYNLEHANTDVLFNQFKEAASECEALLSRAIGRSNAHPDWRVVLPAYDQCIKASHTFNLLDARGVISVTERQAYIGRVRTLAKACAEAWLNSPQGQTPGAGIVGYREKADG